MEEDNSKTNDNVPPASGFNRKRARDDSDSDSAESKLARVDSINSGSDSSGLARHETDLVRVDSVPNSPDPKWIQDDLLNILDDSDVQETEDLDSVIRSFEEEILVPPPEVTSFTGESQPDLGYLLEASDDELGLTPTCSPTAVAGNDLFSSEAAGTGAARFAEMLGFEDGMPNYDSFEYGLGGGDAAVGGYGYNGAAGDFVAVGGLFDYSDENCAAPDDFSAVQWQPESLSAL